VRGLCVRTANGRVPKEPSRHQSRGVAAHRTGPAACRTGCCEPVMVNVNGLNLQCEGFAARDHAEVATLMAATCCSACVESLHNGYTPGGSRSSNNRHLKLDVQCHTCDHTTHHTSQEGCVISLDVGASLRRSLGATTPSEGSVQYTCYKFHGRKEFICLSMSGMEAVPSSPHLATPWDRQ
jgi:hypothetical protein